jgi:putative transcriptional regulator
MDSLERHLLVASPRLPDPNFYRSVVLMIQHDDEGAFGLILNRVSENAIGEIWTMVGEEPSENVEPVYIGGPVRGPLVALHASEEYSEREILPGVYFATHKDNLNRIIDDPERQFRLYNGYSGWAKGQLEQELEVGGWMILPARAEYVFADTEEMWSRAAQEIGEDITRPLLVRNATPSDPSSN